ncbi:MAG: hypothetical protein ACTHOB_18250 [Ginsengibacter sp.]
MHSKFLYASLLFLLLFISCNTTRKAALTPEKDNYTFFIQVEKQQPIDPLIRASGRVLYPTDFKIYPEGLSLRYDSIEDSQLAAIKAEIVKCPGIVNIKIVKE